MAEVFELAKFPTHLALGARVEQLDAFDGTLSWCERYAAAHEADGVEGRLVTLHTFDAPWTSWEMHPLGDELVVCVAGSITLHQEIDGKVGLVTLNAGEAVVNPPGAWHTADVEGTATALFITAGQGTEVRGRD